VKSGTESVSNTASRPGQVRITYVTPSFYPHTTQGFVEGRRQGARGAPQPGHLNSPHLPPSPVPAFLHPQDLTPHISRRAACARKQRTKQKNNRSANDHNTIITTQAREAGNREGCWTTTAGRSSFLRSGCLSRAIVSSAAMASWGLLVNNCSLDQPKKNENTDTL